MTAIGIGLALLGGCGGGGKSATQAPPKVRQGIQVALPWPAGGRIPKRYTCDGADVAPTVRARPQPTAEAIVMTDPDAPGGTFVHWTRWGTTEGRNSFGRTGYSGPCPPKGDRPHHYVVTVYALRSQLGLPAGSDPKKVLQAVRKQAMVSGSTQGLYSR